MNFFYHFYNDQNGIFGDVVQFVVLTGFNEDIFKLLIKNGANVETLDHEEQTPL